MMKTKSICLFFLLIFHVGINAQASWQWATSGVASDPDHGASICTDAGGNVLITGNFQSPSITFGGFGGPTLFKAGTAANSTDLFVVKYTASGSLVWARTDGSVTSEVGNGIATDASGNSFVTGYFQGPSLAFGSTTLTNNGFLDFFLVKYDVVGNVLWAKSAGSYGNDVGTALCVDTSGNVLVTGYFSGPSVAFGTTTLTNTGNQDIFIAKYDAAGNVLWAKAYGGSYDDSGTGISSDALGNSFITGTFKSATLSFSNTTFTNADNTSASQDVFIAKCDASGNLVWAKSATGPSFDFANEVSTDPSGNVFVTGSFQSASFSFGTSTLSSTGGDDLFVAKYDAAGNLLWLRTALGVTGNNDVGNGISADAFGNVFVSGSFMSPSLILGSYTLTNASSSANFSDLFVVKYDAAGNVQWAKSAGGLASDEATAVTAGADGSAYVIGNFESAACLFGSSTLNNSSSPTSGIPDVFVAKVLDIVTGIAEAPGAPAFKIFPNPFSTQALIQLETPLTNGTLILENAVGQTVRKLQNLSAQEITLTRDHLPAGIYLIHLLQDGKMPVTKKLVIAD